MKLIDAIQQLVFNTFSFYVGLIAVVVALASTKPISKRLKSSFFLQFAACLSMATAACAVLILGRGDLEFTGIHIRNLSRCSNLNEGTSWREAESLLNIAIYIPTALIWSFIIRNWVKVWILIALFAASLEVVQAIFDLGVCESIDILRNLIGISAGIVFASIIKQIDKFRHQT